MERPEANQKRAGHAHLRSAAFSVWLLSVALTACGRGASDNAPTTEEPTEEWRRSQIMERERDELRARMEERGGWAAWREALEPFRQGLLECVKEAKKKDRKARVVEGRTGQLEPLDGLQRQCADIASLGETNGAAVDQWSSVSTAVDLSNQLWARGIDLIVLPIPAKFELFPEEFSEAVPENVPVTLVRDRFMLALLERGVEVLDVYPAFMQAKGDNGGPLYLKTDSHWADRAVRIAADLVAERLQRYEVVRNHERQAFSAEDITYTYQSPLVKSLVDEASQNAYEQVADPAVRVLDTDGEPYDYLEHADSPVLLFGDSYMMDKRPGSSFAAHLSRALGMPVSGLSQYFVTRDGVRALARKGRGYIDQRRVIVWFMNSRGFATEWRPAALP